MGLFSKLFKKEKINANTNFITTFYNVIKFLKFIRIYINTFSRIN